MANVIFKGFYNALAAGSLQTTPDVRCMLVMSGFTGETDEDAINLDDIGTIDEFDGVGYQQLDCASVTTAYDDTSNEWRLDFADGNFGDPVGPGSGVVYGMLVYLYVDGTDANDIALAFTDTGFGVNANNGALSLALADDALLFVRQAA